MLPIKFLLIPTYGFGGHLSNSESLCSSNASHQVSAQSLMVWEEMSFKNFQEGCCGGHLGDWNRRILAILNLHIATMLPTKFQLNSTYETGDVENVNR